MFQTQLKSNLTIMTNHDLATKTIAKWNLNELNTKIGTLKCINLKSSYVPLNLFFYKRFTRQKIAVHSFILKMS